MKLYLVFLFHLLYLCLIYHESLGCIVSTTTKPTTPTTVTPSPATSENEFTTEASLPLKYGAGCNNTDEILCSLKINDCPHNRTIQDLCPRACGLCLVCLDYVTMCKTLTHKGYCANDGIRNQCQGFCSLCDQPCRDLTDTGTRCEAYLKKHGCEEPYMQRVCQKSCGLCKQDCDNKFNITDCNQLNNYCDEGLGQDYCRKWCNKCT